MAQHEEWWSFTGPMQSHNKIPVHRFGSDDLNIFFCISRGDQSFGHGLTGDCGIARGMYRRDLDQLFENTARQSLVGSKGFGLCDNNLNLEQKNAEENRNEFR